MKKGAVRYKSWQREGFPKWLQERMADRGWNASDLARALGVVPSLISRWMSGRQKPSPESLRRIAEALHLSHDEVLGAAGYRSAQPTDDDPRRLELIERLREIELTRDRYLNISALLLSMTAEDNTRNG